MLDHAVVSGLRMFARYAYPPNELGYCGPADHAAMLQYGSSGEVDRGLLELAGSFTGPWPYLSLIAAAAGISEPFDQRVVEAYWIGNPLLDRVDVGDFGNVLDERFRHRTGSHWSDLADAIPAGIAPHHAFHVFGVYPWVGMLSNTDRSEPLDILQGCRIRWGEVIEAHGESVTVRSRPLMWDGIELSLGGERVETARRAVDGLALVAPPVAGEWVALHWDWVCDRLTQRQVKLLEHHTTRQLSIVNRQLRARGEVVLDA